MPKVSTDDNLDKKRKELAQGKKYENPGQWLGNQHPITRRDK